MFGKGSLFLPSVFLLVCCFAHTEDFVRASSIVETAPTSPAASAPSAFDTGVWE